MIKDKFFKRQVKWVIIAWLIICTLLLIQYLISSLYYPEFYTSYQIFTSVFVRTITGIGLIFYIIIPSYNYFKKQSIFKNILGLLLICLVCSLVQISLIELFLGLGREKFDLYDVYDKTISSFVLSLHDNIAYYLIFFSILIAIDYMQGKITAIQTKESITRELTQAKLSILSSQLHPHFLFNALNSISSLIEYRQDIAQDMLADVSDLLRVSLQTDYSIPITLEEELNILNKYVDIEKRRFEHQLSITKNIDKETLKIMVPPFILQPLFENSIKHGYTEGVTNLEVKIQAEKTNGGLILSVSNNGLELGHFKGGIGIENLKKRLSTFYGDNYKFEIKQQGSWVVNIIKVLQ